MALKHRLVIGSGLIALALAWTVGAAAGGQPPAPAAASGQATPPAYSANAVQTCLQQCHNMEPVTFILQTPHAVKADARTPFAQHQCETCHGPSASHADTSSNPADVVFSGPKASPVAERNAKCLSCHEGGLRLHWAGSQHESRGVACTDCHNIHASDQKVLRKATQADVCFKCHKTQRAQVRRISSHPLAVTSLSNSAFMACSDCHNPHGSTGPKLLIKNTVNETCYTCHAEKRGPFLWEHAPVADDCTNCHTPHGSTTAPLLKARVPFLCQECHSADHAKMLNSGANLTTGAVTTLDGRLANTAALAGRAQLDARGCLNCHVLIHGSNGPAGSKFQR